MIARVLGAVAAGLALAAGGTWWLALLALVAFLPPSRLAPLSGTVLAVLALPRDPGPTGAVLCFLAGVAAAGALALRTGGAVPLGLVPLGAVAAAALAVLPSWLGPADFWTGSDVAARARILLLAAVALLVLAVPYRPLNWNRSPSSGAGGAAGGTDEAR